MVSTTAEYMPGDTLYEGAILELQRQFTGDGHVNKNYGISDRVSLGSFVETSSNIILEPWQVHLCERLEKLTHQKGQRIMIHKPPQHGGSIIVSQRLPAYLLANQPGARVRVAGYNIEHSTKFGKVNKEIMLSGTYLNMFSDHKDELYIPKRASDEEFSTKIRSGARDAQASFKALGMATGFVGQGADYLIIDDPYASPQDAMSKAIRERTWGFWVGSAKVRINSNTNVIVMFHRYNEEDFAGQLIKEEGLVQFGGKWELISYRAEWDCDERPEVGGPDPLGRSKGQYLSPRLAAQPGYYKEQKKNLSIWNSQFQGKPSKVDGSFFKISRIDIVPRLPVKLVKICRAWDIASSEDGDYTVGVLMGLGEDERIYILNIVRFREDTDERNKQIKATAKLDWLRYRDILKFRLPQDPAAAGKDMALSFRKLLKGYDVEIKLVSGDKEKRADPYSQYLNAGLVSIVFDGVIGRPDDPDDWVTPYLEELRQFPNSGKKDQVDASSDAYSEVALDIETEPGQDIDTMGFSGESDAAQALVDAEYESEAQLIAEAYGIDAMSPIPLGAYPKGVYVDGSRTKEPSYSSSTTRNSRSAPDISRLPTHSQRQAAQSATIRRKGYPRADINRSSRSSSFV